MTALRLRRLTLTEFRSYAALTWSPAGRIAVLSGPNGSGKTNLLEAVSLLVPGRGLRAARIPELPRHAPEATGIWGVAAHLRTAEGEVDIGTGSGSDGSTDRRVFRLNGVPPRNQAEIARQIAAVWLTPQMDRLFLEGASARRRFLDRLVWALEPAHAREVAAFDTAMANRNRLLAENGFSQRGADPAWLAGLEDAMARHGTAVTAARASLAARLSVVLQNGGAGGFPAARLRLLCPIADRLAETAATEVEDWLRAGLAGARPRDAAAGSAALGAHRADMVLEDAATGLPAAQASTGQQKALLIGTILGHAALIADARGFAPILLLDEPAVHLDETHRAALFEALVRLPGQALLTGTDASAFEPLRGAAEFLRAADGNLRPDSGFPPPAYGIDAP